MSEKQDEIRVDSVRLKVKDVTLELSVEDARKLREALGKLLGEDKEPVTVWRDRWSYLPYWYIGAKAGTAVPYDDFKNFQVYRSSDGQTSLTAQCSTT